VHEKLEAAAGPADILNGVTPSWGPFDQIGTQAKVIIAAIWAGALVVCIVITIWGAAQQRYGSASYNTSASERGKTLFASGLLGCVLLGSVPALTAIAYGLGLG